jgi:hypothetical protein
MTNPPRLDESLHHNLCDALLEIRRWFPDFRLGQLIANVAMFAGTDAWGVEDDELLAAAEAFLSQNAEAVASAPPGAA